jgi:hypothetical protein
VIILYTVTIAEIKGTWALKGVWHTSRGIGCNVCGHLINNVYDIENVDTRKTLNVGSECVKNILGSKESDRILKAINSIDNKIKNLFIRPIRQQEIAEFIKNNRDKVACISDSLRFRITHDTNPEETKKILKQFCNLDYKWRKLTVDELAEIKGLQEKAVNYFINTKREITDINILKEWSI